MNHCNKNVLLIGNSKQLEKNIYVEKNIQFEKICRFNFGFAQIYDQITQCSGSTFNTMIVHHYSHDQALKELKQYKLYDNVQYIMMMPPNLSHTKHAFKRAQGIAYEELTNEDFKKIDKMLAIYKFPTTSYVPRTGIIAILYMIFVKKNKVYIMGFDIDGKDSPTDQHIQPGISISSYHSIEEESKLLKRLIREKKLFIF